MVLINVRVKYMWTISVAILNKLSSRKSIFKTYNRIKYKYYLN